MNFIIARKIFSSDFTYFFLAIARVGFNAKIKLTYAYKCVL